MSLNLYRMTFNEWISLPETGRDSERSSWHVFEPGYWHAIASEAAARFAAEFGRKPHVQRVCKSLYRAEELIIAVQTDVSPQESVALPESYAGFRVIQFASQTPEGVLVDVGPPSTQGS
jgi:hypothetical protein